MFNQLKVIVWQPSTVEPRNIELQNSGKTRNSAQFLNNQIITFELFNLQNSGKPRYSGRILADQIFCKKYFAH